MHPRLSSSTSMGLERLGARQLELAARFLSPNFYDPKPANCRSIKPVIDRADPLGNRSSFSCAAVSDRKGVFELEESEGAEGSQLQDDPAALGQTWVDGGQTFKAAGRTREPVVTLDGEVPGDAAVWMLKAD
eukprot:scaffold30047_cov69-Phaeocystis_antarctica.AAC.2